jgi:uncharacterized membrane protein YfcA
MPVTGLELAAAMASIAVAATGQGVVGIGFNVLAVPILLLIDPVLAPVPSLLLAVPLTAWQLLRERGTVDRSGVIWILVGRIPGGLLGLWLILTLSDAALEMTIALIVLTAVIVVGRGVAIRRTASTEFGAGVVSGVTGIIGAIGGPPVALLYRDAPPNVIRPTIAVVFTIGITLSLTLRALGGEAGMDDIRIALALLPAMVIGFGMSSRIMNRVSPETIRTGILVVSAGASVALLLKATL